MRIPWTRPQPCGPSARDQDEYRRQLLIEGTIKSMALAVDLCRCRQLSRPDRALLRQQGNWFAPRRSGQLFTRVSRCVLEGQARVGGTASDRLRAIPGTRLLTPRLYRIQAAALAFSHEIRFNPAVREANRELYLDYTRRTQLRASGGGAGGYRSSQRGRGLIDGLWLELTIDEKAVSVGKAIDLCLHQHRCAGSGLLAGRTRKGRRRGGRRGVTFSGGRPGGLLREMPGGSRSKTVSGRRAGKCDMITLLPLLCASALLAPAPSTTPLIG